MRFLEKAMQDPGRAAAQQKHQAKPISKQQKQLIPADDRLVSHLTGQKSEQQQSRKHPLYSCAFCLPQKRPQDQSAQNNRRPSNIKEEVARIKQDRY